MAWLRFKYACRAARLAEAQADWVALSCAASSKRFWQKAATLRGAAAHSAFPERGMSALVTPPTTASAQS